MQEIEKNANELISEEEKEKRRAEKRRAKKKVRIIIATSHEMLLKMRKSLLSVSALNVQLSNPYISTVEPL